MRVTTFPVRLLRKVSSDLPIVRMNADPGVYHGKMNKHGAVSVQVGADWLGVKPGEFELVDWPELSREWLDVPAVFGALYALRAEVESLRQERDMLRQHVAAAPPPGRYEREGE